MKITCFGGNLTKLVWNYVNLLRLRDSCNFCFGVKEGNLFAISHQLSYKLRKKIMKNNFKGRKTQVML